MKHKLIFFFFLVCANLSNAQTNQPNTIKVKKESKLAKASFDNTVPALMVIDRYGNVVDNKIVSFKLYVKSKKETKEFSGFTKNLTGEMINYLNKTKSASKLFFSEIKVLDENEHLVDLPDLIEVWFPNCKNCKP